MDKLLSRKFIVTLVYMLLVAGRDSLGLDLGDGELMNITAAVVSYLAAQGWIDSREKKQ